MDSKRIIYITKENQINKILKKYRKSGEGAIHILFTSLWDRWSKALINRLEREYGDNEDPAATPVYILNSFKTPHSFKIFKTNKVPHMIRIDSSGLYSEDYLPKIYENLLTLAPAEYNSRS